MFKEIYFMLNGILIVKIIHMLLIKNDLLNKSFTHRF